MKVYYNYTGFNVTDSVVTIGVFDGVHKGHVEILNRLKESALENNCESVVITFWPHPRIVLGQDAEIKLLNTLSEKEELLSKQGIDHLVALPFTEAFSKLSPDDFVREVLVDGLHVKHLIVGFNHHFGHGREGNFEFIQRAGERYGFTVERIEPKLVEDERVSSTLIRKALIAGEVDIASVYLGYHYSISGIVVKGEQLGRKIGFPTANLAIDNEYKLLPKSGVYIVEMAFENKLFPAMVNIGYRPTVNVNPGNITIEVHILNFNEDIYDKDISIIFYKRIRDEIKFSNLEELTNQLNKDKNSTLLYFK